MDGLEGPNTQDRAGRLIAETGHHLEDMIPLVIQRVFWRDGWQFMQRSSSSGRNRCDHHRRDLSSVFTTVGDADTPLHPQFFRAVTFESQSLTEEKRSLSIRQPVSSQTNATLRCEAPSQFPASEVEMVSTS